MINKNNNKKLITFSPRSMDMIEAIMEETGFNTTTQVVTRGIEELYKNTFKYGKDPLNGLGTQSSDPELIDRVAKRKVALKVAEEKAKVDIKLAPKIAICENELRGKVEGGKCIYKRYFIDGKSQEDTIDINQVGDYLVENMFVPTKEAVFRNNPEIEKLFNE